MHVKVEMRGWSIPESKERLLQFEQEIALLGTKRPDLITTNSRFGSMNMSDSGLSNVRRVESLLNDTTLLNHELVVEEVGTRDSRLRVVAH